MVHTHRAGDSGVILIEVRIYVLKQPSDLTFTSLWRHKKYLVGLLLSLWLKHLNYTYIEVTRTGVALPEAARWITGVLVLSSQ
jgi:hypothetical protein